MHGVMKAAVCLTALVVSQAWGDAPAEQVSRSSLASQAFSKPELVLVNGNLPLQEV
ncbi:hypothetical protein NVS55_20440 [Myxococcus stipitatus]|uniref:hypothetical protein n=1 Tax=Myxococcus stipitatus TaxID=83455 RepID=UPI003145045F